MGYLRLQDVFDTLISISLCLGRKETHALYPSEEMTIHKENPGNTQTMEKAGGSS